MEKLKSALENVLSVQERTAVINPLASNPEIRKWAEQLTAGGTNDQEKARRLFEGLLVRPIDPNALMGRRTAHDVFDSWNDARVNLMCQDYTFLYVALAREAGLRSWYVLVTEDYRGKLVSHACAGVAVGRLLLIDPSYRWFGVPHKQYRFLNDLETIGLYMVEQSIDWRDMNKPMLNDALEARAGIKLAATVAMPHFWLAYALADIDDARGARKYLDEGFNLDSISWTALTTKLYVEARKQNRKLTASDCELIVRLHPEYPEGLYSLACAYQSEGKWNEARDYYKRYLETDASPQFATEARRAYALVDYYLSHPQNSSAASNAVSAATNQTPTR